MNMLEQVRVASLSVETTVTARINEIPMIIGDGEVAIALASKFQVISYASQINDARAMFYRKTETLPDLTAFGTTAATWHADSSCLDTWALRFDTTQAVESRDCSKWIYSVYPEPFVLVRQPSLCHLGSISNVILVFTLWYKFKKVSDAELSQLLVKHHA